MTRNPLKTLRLLPAALPVAIVLCAMIGCSDSEVRQSVTDTLVTAHPREATAGTVNFDPEQDVMRLPTYIVPGPLKEIFRDTNDLQLPAAIKNGIEPITDFRSAWHTKRPMQLIYSCDEYMIDTLTMSMPYLVPRAAQLLKDIASDFQDTIRSRGKANYRLRVTSLLRTDHSVKRLMRRNRGATEQSCHRYGTTFDISWVKFDCLDSTRMVSLEDLKNILAEIVYNHRRQGRCYAIYERRQGCFHITVK